MTVAALVLKDTLHMPSWKGGTVLDIGPGKSSVAAKHFLDHGASDVISIDPTGRCSRVGPGHHTVTDHFENITAHASVQAIWAAHVLEHVRNPGAFLDHCWNMLAPDGVLFLVVPPLKHEIVGGHISLWNMGLLWYHLILAGFNVRDGHFIQRKYNLAAFVSKRPDRSLPSLLHDAGDIETLKDFWPVGHEAKQGFNGQVREQNWF